MGIDKIGKSTGAPDVTGAETTGGPSGVTRSFAEVHAGQSARAAPQAVQTTATTQSSPLEQLRAGTLDLPGYLDARVSQATAGLRGLSEAQLDTIRTVLREQLATDPSLAELVTRATGQTPAEE